DNLMLIIGTANTSRKYRNIIQNNKVALVIGGWEDHITIQYEGVAIELAGEEKEKLTEIYLTKIPEVKKYALRPEQRFFKIIPSWIRCTGYSKEAEVFEVNF
ncbi:MAG: pyridoxamine 5'-phosphate oxidase family protein, partial [Candidatus Levybacteria bacterium]|nr:pyridoxamine 5'-phosphate oxidase family protein [Candidatus Levybacteria bacterium]